MAASDDEYDRPLVGAPERDSAALKRVAHYQRSLVGVVLAQLVLWVGYVVLGALGGGDFSGVKVAVAVTFLFGAIGGVYIFLLSWELRGPLAALVFALATVVPCLGLLVLVLVNGYATAELKRHRVPVGLFGASQDDVDRRPSPYDPDEDEGW